MMDDISILKKMRGQKVLVIGDFILDVFIQGNCTRIAPEASVPVVDQHSRNAYLGGAANVAANLASLGAEVFYCSVTGDDVAFEEAKNLLSKFKISSQYLINDRQRTTLVKTRISAGNQSIVRLDTGTTEILQPETTALLCENITSAFADVDAVLIADYDKGMVTAQVINTLKGLLEQSPKLVAVDAKQCERFAVLAPTLIKPNYAEAAKMIAANPDFRDRLNGVRTWKAELFSKTNAKHIVLTMDADGVAYFNEDRFVGHYPVPKVADPKVSGAGDTFIAACVLAMLATGKCCEAIKMAIKAAEIVVRKMDTAICSQEELVLELLAKEKLLAGNILNDLVKQHKARGRKIVFTNGCFDILHSGHVSYLKAAKAKGDILIVGLNDDDSIRRLKGASRPINTLKNRLDVLAELSCIDYIIPYGDPKDDTPIKLIAKIKPDVFVKGADYQYQFLPEGELLRKINCEIQFVPLVANQSTTNVISRIKEPVLRNVNLAN